MSGNMLVNSCYLYSALMGYCTCLCFGALFKTVCTDFCLAFVRFIPTIKMGWGYKTWTWGYNESIKNYMGPYQRTPFRKLRSSYGWTLPDLSPWKVGWTILGYNKPSFPGGYLVTFASSRRLLKALWHLGRPHEATLGDGINVVFLMVF